MLDSRLRTMEEVEKRKTSTLRVVSIVMSCVGMTVAGSPRAFWAYVYSLKKHFLYTQSTVEAIGSIANLGTCMGLPAGILCERIGPRWMSVVFLLINIPGYLLLYSTTLMENFYHGNPWLQYIFFFVTGLGSICIQIPCIRTGINNINPRHWAKSVALLDGFFVLGPVLFSTLYGTIFAAGHTFDEENQNLGGYFLMSLVVNVVVGCLCIVFLKEYPMGNTESESDKLIAEKDDPPKTSEDVSVFAVMHQLDFHYLYWAFLFSSGVQALILINQAILLKSFYLERYTTLLTSVSAVPGIIAEFLVGILSDSLLDLVPRSAYLVGMNIVQTIITFLAIFFCDNLMFFILFDLTIGFANGLIWCVIPTIISELYGMKYFARNWGFFILSVGIFLLVLQQIFGWIYEKSISKSETVIDCSGLHCFTWSFIMCCTLSFCASVFSLATLQSDLRGRKRQDESKLSD